MPRRDDVVLDLKKPQSPRRRRWPSLHQWRLWLSGLIGSRYDGLTNFHVVQPGVLLRCGQPRLQDLEHIRQTHGLRTIICARGGTRHPLRGRWFRRERDYCARHAIHFQHVRLSDTRGIAPQVLDEFVAMMRDPLNHPVLVHCEQGYHRTGVLVAAYRLALCRWSIERALAEMEACGFELHRPKRQALVAGWLEWAEARGGSAQSQITR